MAWAGSRHVRLPALILCGAIAAIACGSFGAAPDDPDPILDGGTKPPKGDGGAHADADAMTSVDDAAVVLVSNLPPLPPGCVHPSTPSKQGFSGADLGDWIDMQSLNATANISPVGGRAGDGALSIEYEAAIDTEAKHRAGKQLVIGDAGCLQIEIVFRYTQLEGAELYFSELKFDDQTLLAFTITQDRAFRFAEQDISDSGGSTHTLGTFPNVPPDVWHIAGLSFVRTQDGPVPVVTFDGTPIALDAPDFDFGGGSRLEVGLSFASHSGSGADEIDSVTIQ